MTEKKTTPLSKALLERRSALRLVAISEDAATVHPLPPRGTVCIGRAEGAEVRIDDSSISRRHALVHLGPPVRLEDLGSSNGTLVDGRRLEAGETVELRPGALIELGATTLVLQGSLPGASAGPTDAMAELRLLLERVAASNLSVLLLGETGAGKSLLAEEIHRRSKRAERPFLALNCAALSESLLESELFGHERGAFTGALQAKPGLLESADGGTVFLDEVGELSASIQAKLLRAVEQREVMRVGALKPRRFDVRFISATNRDLEGDSAQDRFRQDLYFRLNGISIRVPPLRQRRGELRALASQFATGAAAQHGWAEAPTFSDDAWRALEGHDWPGNIRELRNVVERAVVLAGGGQIRPEHLALQARRRPEAKLPEGDDERSRILRALEECAGNQSRAAKLLGISRTTLVARLDEYGVKRPRKPSGGAEES